MKNKSDNTQPFQKASRTRSLLRFFFNPRAWGDWERTKSISQFFLEMVERFFVIKKPNKQIKNFEEVVTKFALDEPSLQAKSKGLLRLSYTILAMTGFIFLYCIYQAVYGSWIGVMVAAVQFGIAAALTFRYHFWAFQIQQRKLGCSFKDWLKNTFAGDHK